MVAVAAVVALAAVVAAVDESVELCIKNKNLQDCNKHKTDSHLRIVKCLMDYEDYSEIAK